MFATLLNSAARHMRVAALGTEDLPRAIERLRHRLAAPSEWNQPVLQRMREGDLSCDELRFFMFQYYHYVRRFAGWMSLVIAHADDDRIRVLLLPNLSDEVTDPESGKSHRRLLLELLITLGIAEGEIERSRPHSETEAAENFFWTLLSSGKTLESLFALGPGTEGVSDCFLAPMEQALRRAFSLDHNCLRYFTVHKPDVEYAHVDSLDRAIALCFDDLCGIDRTEAWLRGEQAAQAALRAHQRLFSIPLEESYRAVR